ncbi:hypothetical protein BJ138DRAFT_1104094 [Hygrophoropsis aurantiaca]|uniref:Uncharacterized protein n=1 Tax=Hygrophoropsis aurantiaca TaxID=72124 RepID=A0ACB8A2P3_9AGAM|nr:hypothetical protein BJ138DRAFT_1104094 [Hygrophoropsis aurantiaca]
MGISSSPQVKPEKRREPMQGWDSQNLNCLGPGGVFVAAEEKAVGLALVGLEGGETYAYDVDIPKNQFGTSTPYRLDHFYLLSLHFDLTFTPLRAPPLIYRHRQYSPDTDDTRCCRGRMTVITRQFQVPSTPPSSPDTSKPTRRLQVHSTLPESSSPSPSSTSMSTDHEGGRAASVFKLMVLLAPCPGCGGGKEDVLDQQMCRTGGGLARSWRVGRWCTDALGDRKRCRVQTRESVHVNMGPRQLVHDAYSVREPETGWAMSISK